MDSDAGITLRLTIPRDQGNDMTGLQNPSQFRCPAHLPTHSLVKRGIPAAFQSAMRIFNFVTDPVGVPSLR